MVQRKSSRWRARRKAGRVAWACFLALLVTGTAAPREAHAQSTTKQQAVELTMLSGTNRAFEDYYEQAHLELIKHEDTIPKDVHERLRARMLEAFHPTRLNSQFVAALQKSASPQSIQTGLDWMKSPLGLRLTRAEVEATTREGRKQMKVWAERMGAVPPVKERLDTIVRIVRASNYAPVATEAAVTVIEPILQTENAAQPEAKQKQQQEIQAELTKMRNTLVPKKAQERIVELLYAYRQVEDVDLRRYATFLESQAGIAFLDSMNAAHLAALRQSNDWIATRFKELF